MAWQAETEPRFLCKGLLVNSTSVEHFTLGAFYLTKTSENSDRKIEQELHIRKCFENLNKPPEERFPFCQKLSVIILKLRQMAWKFTGKVCRQKVEKILEKRTVGREIPATKFPKISVYLARLVSFPPYRVYVCA